MGLKKKLMFGLLKGLLHRRHLRGYVKKTILMVTVMGIIFLVGSLLLIGFGVNQLLNLTTAPSDIELVTLIQLEPVETIIKNLEAETSGFIESSRLIFEEWSNKASQ